MEWKRTERGMVVSGLLEPVSGTTYSLLDVSVGQASREVGVAHRRRRNRDLRKK